VKGDMIYYLLYYGVESFKFEQKDFEELLNQARERNGQLGITGKLIYCEGTFIQVLEGDEHAIKEVYQSIEKDSRLIATKLVAEGLADKRYFKDWSMDFDEVSLDAINELESCNHPNVADYITNAPAVKLLKLLNTK